MPHTPRFQRLILSLALSLIAACGGDAPPADPVFEFVGSTSCANCHQLEFRAWRGSHHELAMQPATEASVLGDFEDARFDYFGEVFELSVVGGNFQVTALNAAGHRETWVVSDTFGIEPLQQYLVELPAGRKQALPIAWDTRPAAEGGQRWFHLYPDEYVGPGDPLHWTGPYQNWNFMCAECHSTNLDMAYDFDADTFATTFSEISVGCEACHGPGSVHVSQATAVDFDDRFGLQVNLNDRGNSAWVFEPSDSIATRTPSVPHQTSQVDACGRCHARRGPVAEHYEYGEPLADAYNIALLDDPLYFADGQIREEVYVYGSFLQSRMFEAGVVCSDCHEPHSADLRSGDSPSDVCAQCHLKTEFASIDHSGHAPTAAQCVDCHMASRTYMGNDERRDHSFRVPRPDLHAATGVPLACNNCHDDDALIAAGEHKDRPHFATALAAARQRAANDEVLEALELPDVPAIARATLVSLLVEPFGPAEWQALEAAVGDADPLVRIGALRALRNSAAETRAAFGGTGLDDPIRSVRLEATSTYVEVRDLLPIEKARAFGKASEEYTTALRHVGSMPDALASLASFESAMGDQRASLQLLQRATRAVPGNPVIQHALGLAYVRAGQREQALMALRRAHELEPADRRFVYVYGVALNSLGQASEAIRVLTEAYQQHPNDYDIGWALATILRDSGQRQDARAVAAELTGRYPDDDNLRRLIRSLDSESINR